MKDDKEQLDRVEKYYLKFPDLIIDNKYILDKGGVNEIEVILLNFCGSYCNVMLPYSNDDIPKSFSVKIERLTKINNG